MKQVISFFSGRSLIYAALSTALFSTSSIAQQATDLAIEEILVTAQKRSESLVEVPIAMSVFTAAMINNSGAQELRDLGDYIPNVNISQGTDFGASIQIRGVGANSRNIGFDSRVGVYLDGVYLGQGPALNQDLVDLDQIEVLRGPQGTLFGKNTVAGAISMISTKPGPEFAADATVKYGNYDYLELKGVLNIPMGDVVSARISAQNRTRDGWVKNVWDPSMVPTTANFVIPGVGPVFGVPLCTAPGSGSPPGCVQWAVGPSQPPDTRQYLNDIDTTSYRAQLRIQPSEKLDINIAIDGLESDRHALIGEPLTDTFGSTLDTNATKYGDVPFSETGSETRDIFGANVNVDYTFDNGYALRSITAYRDTDVQYINDTDASPIDFLVIDYSDKYEQTTQEFQLISPDESAFEYVAGVYYYKQDSSSVRDAVTGNAGWLFRVPPGGGAFSHGTVDTSSWAAFFNGTYDFNNGWRLSFGGRYSDVKKDVVYHLDGTRSGVFGIGTTPAGGYIDSNTDTDFSPMASLSYALGDNSHVYFKYSTGFKSGGYNLDYVTQADLEAGITFDSETVDSYELGWKGTYMDNRLAINVAAFIADYQDYQVNQFFDLGFDAVTGTQLTSIRITNAAEVDTSGLEVEASFNATANLTVRGSLGLLDATFADFPGGTSQDIPNPAGGNPITVPTNAKGNDLPRAPSTNATLGFEYVLPFNSVGLLVSLDALYTSKYYTTIANEKVANLTGDHGAIFTFDLPAYMVPTSVAYGQADDLLTFNGRIGLLTNNDTWEVYLWGRNLTDEQSYVDYFRDFFGSLSATPITPRTYGIEATYRFR